MVRFLPIMILFDSFDTAHVHVFLIFRRIFAPLQPRVASLPLPRSFLARALLLVFLGPMTGFANGL